MNRRDSGIRSTAILVVMVLVSVTSAAAQVGKSDGLLDMNTASEKDLLTVPHMTAEIVKTVLEKRPFDGVTALNTHLTEQKLTKEQITAVFGKAFVHINLNTATKEEIMLIPGAGKKMSHEFAEYRPWTSWAQFRKEIGKYVGEKETARLAQYCFIPMNVNKASDEDLATIPGLSKQTIEQVGKGKPWKKLEDFQKELAKTAGEKEAKRIARFLVVE
jgi:DNA uptake protein ComE-like DNA-binding protein